MEDKIKSWAEIKELIIEEFKRIGETSEESLKAVREKCGQEVHRHHLEERMSNFLGYPVALVRGKVTTLNICLDQQWAQAEMKYHFNLKLEEAQVLYGRLLELTTSVIQYMVSECF